MQRAMIQELLGALMIFGISLYFLLGAFRYDLGTPRQMGPGFFPMTLGAAGTFYGVVLIVKALVNQDESNAISWRPLAFVPLAIVACAMSIETLGLIPAVVLASVLTSLGYKDITVGNVITIAMIMVAIVTFIGSYLLGMPVALFGSR
ncbi:tripartite tricarboxylate transporter TctB family protein [Roseovarius pacificus]|uniref:tripartite tricarboxylate transporter TctB family protein n=1 Tax=Roseovarius pacificus TaxID=337701 RepID=UPI002A186DBC|nr:tripartite tricarboxylate transporter TctB family protein [Roseovarius pacificus]